MVKAATGTPRVSVAMDGMDASPFGDSAALTIFSRSCCSIGSNGGKGSGYDELILAKVNMSTDQNRQKGEKKYIPTTYQIKMVTHLKEDIVRREWTLGLVGRLPPPTLLLLCAAGSLLRRLNIGRRLRKRLLHWCYLCCGPGWQRLGG